MPWPQKFINAVLSKSGYNGSLIEAVQLRNFIKANKLLPDEEHSNDEHFATKVEVNLVISLCVPGLPDAFPAPPLLPPPLPRLPPQPQPRSLARPLRAVARGRRSPVACRRPLLAAVCRLHGARGCLCSALSPPFVAAILRAP